MADSNTHPSDETTTHDTPPVKNSSLKNSMIAAGIVMMLMVTASLFIDEAPVTPAAEQAQATAAVTPPTPKPVPKAKEPVETISVALPATLLPPTINLSGTWYDDSGTRFEAIQKGKKFIATGFNLFGMASKQMHGTVSGDKLYFTLQDGFIETDGVGALNEDGEHFDYILVQGKFREEGQLHLNHKGN